MKPFAYQAPTSIGEAIALLADTSRNARPLAGGTDLISASARADCVVPFNVLATQAHHPYDIMTLLQQCSRPSGGPGRSA